MPQTEKIDFNKFADEYEKILQDDLQFFGEENGYFAEYKVEVVEKTVSSSPGKILEYGCGIGLNLRYFKKYFPDSQLFGCDISEKSIDIAASQNSNAKFFLIDKDITDQHKENFDLIFVSCVFHHIAPELREDSIKQINKLLRPGGQIYIFEHNPYNPVTRKIVRDCVWDKDAILLKAKETNDLLQMGGFEITEKKYTLFFPAQLSFMRPLEKILGNIPLGGQYYIKARKVKTLDARRKT